MICNNCNTNNNDGAKYCVSCGLVFDAEVVVLLLQFMGYIIDSP